MTDQQRTQEQAARDRLVWNATQPLEVDLTSLPPRLRKKVERRLAIEKRERERETQRI